MESPPLLECRLWWATAGTMCVVVCAATDEDARVLVQARFRDAGVGWGGKVQPATSEQWTRYQLALQDVVDAAARTREIKAEIDARQAAML